MELDNVMVMIYLLTFDFKFTLLCAVLLFKVDEKSHDAGEEEGGNCTTRYTGCF
jgi:hypothetical protein